MYRRDFVKAVVALPLASWFGKSVLSQRASTTVAAPTKLLFLFEGPFAIVLDHRKPSRIQVFTPMDNPFKRHVFFLNNDQYRDTVADQLHDITFIGDDALALKGSFPTPDPCLTGFNYQSSRGPTTGDDLIQIDLPSPDKIYCAPGYSTPVKFESGFMTTTPSGHVLEYSLKDLGKTIKITDSLMHDQAPKLDDRFPGALVFGFQVGLAPINPNQDPDSGGVHAVAFHNDGLLKRFPPIALDVDKRLASVGKIRKKKRERNKALGFDLLSTAVECKIGGFLVTT